MIWECRPVVDLTIDSEENLFPRGFLILPDLEGPLKKVFRTTAENSGTSIAPERFSPYPTDYPGSTTVVPGEPVTARLNVKRDLGVAIPDSPGKRRIGVYATALYMHSSFPSEHQIGPVELELDVQAFESQRFEAEFEYLTPAENGTQFAVEIGVYEHPQHGRFGLLVAKENGTIRSILKCSRIGASPPKTSTALWDPRTRQLHLLHSTESEGERYMVTEPDFGGIRLVDKFGAIGPRVLERERDGSIGLRVRE